MRSRRMNLWPCLHIYIYTRTYIYIYIYSLCNNYFTYRVDHTETYILQHIIRPRVSHTSTNYPHNYRCARGRESMRIPPMISENTLERYARFLFVLFEEREKENASSILNSLKKDFSIHEKQRSFSTCFPEHSLYPSSRSAILSPHGSESGARHRNSPPFVSTWHRFFPIDRSLSSYLSHLRFSFSFVSSSPRPPPPWPSAVVSPFVQSNRKWWRLVQIPRIPFESISSPFRGI